MLREKRKEKDIYLSDSKTIRVGIQNKITLQNRADMTI